MTVVRASRALACAHRLESLGDVLGDLGPSAAVCQEREVEVKARCGVVLPVLGQRGDGRTGARPRSSGSLRASRAAAAQAAIQPSAGAHESCASRWASAAV